MKLYQLFTELRRRNVYKVAVAYAVIAWIVIQFATQVFPFFEIPAWSIRLVILLLLAGFPFAAIFAWVFEITPEGIKRTTEVAPEESIRDQTGQKLMVAIVAAGVLAIALNVFLFTRERHASLSGSSSLAEPVVSEKSIAVLPFENLSDEKGAANFADGVQDELLTNLSRIAALKSSAGRA